MTKAEIKQADEKTLQKRWVELMNDPEVYAPYLSHSRMEYLMIGVRLSILRGQNDEAIVYSCELYEQFGESIS